MAKCGGVGDWATVWQILPKAVYLLIFNASAFRIITRWNGWRKSLTILVPVFGYIKLFIWPLAPKIVQKLSGKLLAAFLFAERFPSPENGLKANFVGTKSKVFNNKTRDNWLSEGGKYCGKYLRRK